MHLRLSIVLITISNYAHAVDLVSATGMSSALLGLVIALAILGAAAWILKRINSNRMTSNATAKVIGGVTVGSRERVLIVEIANQWIIVGVAPGQVRSLLVMPRPEHSVQSEKPHD